MDLTVGSMAMILLAGIAAGFFNVIAGGGSLITVPVLIFAGLPPIMANGTNRVAILSQNIMAVQRFRHKGYFPLKEGVILGLSATIGAIAGSLLAVEISGDLFKKILSGVMILMLVLTLAGNRRKEEGDNEIRRMPLLIPLFLLVGLYGGFIQAGTGFIVIAVFSIVSGTNLVMTNAVKVLVILIYTIPSLLIFVLNGQVVWLAGLTMAVGNICGAWIGAKVTVEKGDRVIKGILAVAVSAMAIKLFFF